MPNTIIVVGPSGGNQCCMCTSVTDGTEHGTYSKVTGCPSGVCKSVLDLARVDSVSNQTCATYTCCPCPTGGKGLTADITFGNQSGSVSASISLNGGEKGYEACRSGSYNGIDVHLGAHQGAGAGCYADEDMYETSNGYVPIDIREPRYEKWVGSGSLCSAGTPGGDDPYGDPLDCSGMDIIVSLCCCGPAGGPPQYGSDPGTSTPLGTLGVKECAVCNFRLDISFVPIDHGWSGAITRPAGYWACSPNCWGHGAGSGPRLTINSLYKTFTPTLMGGTCGDEVELLTYKGLLDYWDCECLHGGQEQDGVGAPAHPITGTITIS